MKHLYRFSGHRNQSVHRIVKKIFHQEASILIWGCKYELFR